MALKDDAQRWLGAAQLELQIVLGTFKEKGAERFGRCLVLGGALVLGSYMIVYSPAKKREAALDRKIASAKSIAKYADQFSDLRDQLNGVYFRLPLAKDRNTWLLNTTRDTLSADSLVTDSLTPPGEQNVVGLIYQRMSVSLSRLKFEQFTRWAQHLESVKPFARITELNVSKGGEPGESKVTCEVSTVIPIQRLGTGQ